MGDMSRTRFRGFGTWLLLIGPGLSVMLADSDVGSIITAAQSGALWRYTLVLPQILLIPFLYFIQEITVRLGIVTHKGHAELVRLHFGRGWAYLSSSTLFLAALGALVTEYVGVASIGELFGITRWVSVPLAMAFLVVLVVSGSYRHVERVAILVGLFELLFIPAALLSHPDWGAAGHGMISQPLLNADYRFLLAVNVGAVIMPWMIFYQQGAVIDKKLGKGDLRAARMDTLLGAIVTQIIMIAVIVATASASSHARTSLQENSVANIVDSLQPLLGSMGAKILVGLGIGGAGLVAAIVVSLAGAWGVGEALGVKKSLNLQFGEARGFYVAFIVANLIGAGVVLSGVALTGLTLDIELLNALVLPLVLGFLLLIERAALPAEYRMRSAHRAIAWVLVLLVVAFGLFMGYDTIRHGLGMVSP
jgi:Mn2+/Fe2+ NRAMP family transporter